MTESPSTDSSPVASPPADAEVNAVLQSLLGHEEGPLNERLAALDQAHQHLQELLETRPEQKPVPGPPHEGTA